MTACTYVYVSHDMCSYLHTSGESYLHTYSVSYTNTLYGSWHTYKAFERQPSMYVSICISLCENICVRVCVCENALYTCTRYLLKSMYACTCVLHVRKYIKSGCTDLQQKEAFWQVCMYVYICICIYTA